MEFGRVTDPTGICFSLPADPDTNAQVLNSIRKGQTRWHTGLTGWREQAWKGDIYPITCRPDQFLPLYAGSFNCVELNPTYYHPPSPDRVRQWVGMVPEHFRFCPKVWQGVSHQEVPDPSGAIRTVQQAHAWFGEYLGPAFIQFPARTGRAQLAWIETILDHWAPEQELFIEVRDPELLQQDQWLSRLADRKIGLVITDVAGHRSLTHMQLTIPRTMLRFVATGYPELDRERMKDWIIRLDQWSTSGLSEAWVFFHHADNAQAPAVARLWADCIKELGTTFISMQTPLHYRPNTQGNLFDQG
jgi:uncharacterized protein YecE (DUF72 family)